MPLYYEGDIDSDYANALSRPHVGVIERLAGMAGSGRIQQIALQPYRDNQCSEELFYAVKGVANLVGIFSFCWVTQVLWAKRLRDDYNLPVMGALDMSYSDEYAPFLPQRT